jgi:hypothetical protein
MIIGQAKQNTSRMLEAYQKLDALDIGGFVSYMKDDITYTFWKQSNGAGKTDMEMALQHLLTGVERIHHKFNCVYETGHGIVSETQITCTKVNSSQVYVSGLICLKMEEGFIKVMKVFIDFTPFSV